MKKQLSTFGFFLHSRFVSTSIFLLPLCFALLSSCSKTDETPAAGAAGTFPNFYTLTAQVVPATSSTAAVSVSRRNANDLMTVSYNTTAADFTTAFDLNQNLIGQVFNDAGISGPVKSMLVLLAGAQSDIDMINTNYSDSNGDPTNCTAIASGTTLTTPFLGAATTPVFNVWDDAGKYTCYAGSDGAFTFFGRSAVTDADATCTDAFEYYVMTASSQDDATNSENVDTRGTTVDSAGIKKFYYNGCTKVIKLAYGQTTLYSAGVEFSSRTELTGNVNTSEFTIKTDFIDADTTYATHNTFLGTGKSRGTTDSPGRFIMSYRSDNCGTASDSSACTLGTPNVFCSSNSGTANSYSLEDSANCSTLETAYDALTALVRSDLPSGYFTTALTAFGL